MRREDSMARLPSYPRTRPASSLLATSLLILAVSSGSQASTISRAVHATLDRYLVIDLGTLDGTHSTATGINDQRWIVGSANLAGDKASRAFLRHDGRMTDLGTLGG